MRARFAVVLGAALLAGACSSGSTAQPDSTATSAAPAPDDRAAESGDTSSVAGDWVVHQPGGDCRCADGGEFELASRTADTSRVVLYFEGGGACFSAETCSFESGTYNRDGSADRVIGEGGEGGEGGDDGIFDFDNAENPFADWSFVYVPYCTGDVHIGNNVQRYSDDLEVAHVGFVNASAGLDLLLDTFPDATEVFVTGSSAGGVPAPLFGGLVADALPDADVAVLSDASGAYPDNPAVNLAIGGLWGTTNVVPDWEVNEGLAPEDYSIPGLFTQAGLHDPDIRFARYDTAYDDVQRQFSRLAAFGGDDQLEVVLANEADIEAAGVPIASYIAAGTDHTILGKADLYTLETDGVRVIDWLAAYVRGESVDDVRCTDCGRPDGEG